MSVWEAANSRLIIWFVWRSADVILKVIVLDCLTIDSRFNTGRSSCPLCSLRQDRHGRKHPWRPGLQFHHVSSFHLPGLARPDERGSEQRRHRLFLLDAHQRRHRHARADSSAGQPEFWIWMMFRRYCFFFFFVNEWMTVRVCRVRPFCSRWRISQASCPFALRSTSHRGVSQWTTSNCSTNQVPLYYAYCSGLCFLFYWVLEVYNPRFWSGEPVRLYLTVYIEPKQPRGDYSLSNKNKQSFNKTYNILVFW